MLDSFELTRAARALQTFVIDELSNWYLRRSRRRFWKNEMSDDKRAAYETFYRVLEGVAVLSAPFIPFLSEAVYLRLKGRADLLGAAKADEGAGSAVLRGAANADEDAGNAARAAAASVHLERYPVHDESLIEGEIEEKMAGVLRAVSVGHALRNTAQVKVRMPLAEMFVHSPYGMDTGWVGREEFAYLVRDELNIKKITLLDAPESLVKYRVKPEFSKLGKRFGKSMKLAAAIIESLDAAAIKALLSSGEIYIELDGKKELITREEVQILQETAEGFVAGSDGDLTVILDTRLNPELRKEGLARELVNRIQNFRKDSGLEVSDRIELAYRAAGEVSVVMSEFGEHISSETLAAKLVEGAQDWRHTTSFKVGDHTVELWLRRI
jgi:isoleucyl-tRNA synthetase